MNNSSFRFSSTFLTCLLAVSWVQLWAADKTLNLPQTPAVCSIPIGPTITASQASNAIHAALNTDPDPNTYYVLHVVTYNNDLSVSEQHWYVYYAGWYSGNQSLKWLADTRLHSHFDETRVYGSKDVAIIYFHRVPGVTASVALTRAQGAAHAQPAASAPNATVVEHLVNQKVIGGDFNAGGDIAAAGFDLVNAATQKPLFGYLGVAIDSTFKPLTTTLSYRIDITKKLPAPIQNAQGILKAISGQGALTRLAIQMDTVTLCGGQSFDASPLPSDMTITANMDMGNATSPKPTAIGNNTFDNEGKYRYDFSFALPLKSYSDLTVNSTDFTLSAKTVSKQNLFAVANLSPIAAYDTKKANFEILPVILYGMPISGQPLHHQLVAGAIGLNKVQFFVGTMFSLNNVLPNTPAAPAGTASSTVGGTGPVKQHWGTKLTYGINFPVSTITNLLKKN